MFDPCSLWFHIHIERCASSFRLTLTMTPNQFDQFQFAITAHHPFDSEQIHGHPRYPIRNTAAWSHVPSMKQYRIQCRICSKALFPRNTSKAQVITNQPNTTQIKLDLVSLHHFYFHSSPLNHVAHGSPTLWELSYFKSNEESPGKDITY